MAIVKLGNIIVIQPLVKLMIILVGQLMKILHIPQI